MNITVLGTGYVGLSTGVCLANIGHQVTCMDVDTEKIAKLNKGISPIYEPGIEELIKNNLIKGTLRFTASHKEAVTNAEIIIIAVGTPQKSDGSVNLSYLRQAALDIAPYLAKEVIIVIKSTVPVGTNDYVKQVLVENVNRSIKLDMISNPEFLREGTAIQDTQSADRIIIGYENIEAAEKIKTMYQPFHVPFVLTSIKSAEMIKYASNAFLATKISFINEIANLCEKTGADIEDVAKGMGMDKRIGASFLQAGIGYGGSCFPKDVQALIHTARFNGIDFSLLKETVAINENQYRLLIHKARNRFGKLTGRKIALLGLSFKPNTDDMREAPSIKIIHELLQEGASISTYDPVAMNNAKKLLDHQAVTWAVSVEQAIKDADAIFIVTEWDEFIDLPYSHLIKNMKHPIIFDGRNCLKEEQLKECINIEYYPVGRPEFINSQ